MTISPQTSEEGTKSPPKKKSSPLKNSSTTTASADLEAEGGELEADESVGSVGKRFLRWTKEDLFDWNPEYARTLRGIFTLLQIVVSALAMIMVSSGCKQASLFACHSSVAFMFVVASSSVIQSTLLVVCCLLSKKGDVIIRSSPLELLFYIVFFILYLIAGLVVEGSLRSNDYGHHAILAGGIFGLTNSVLYLISALWSYMFFNFGRRDEK